MARTSKPKTTTEVVENTPVPVVTEQLASVPVVEKVSKAKKTVPVATTVVPSVSQTAVEVSSVVTKTEEPVVTDVEQVNTFQSIEFQAKLNQLSSIIASLKSEYRLLEKKWTRELKLAQKVSSKRKRKTGNRAPSGFVKPARISDELAKFLEKPTGTEMARTDVTREINKYIRSHNLQDKENGRKINPDTKLTNLLKLKTTDELTYFNLQRYMSPHFSKVVKEVVQSTTV